MKNSYVRIGALLLALLITLSGCGEKDKSEEIEEVPFSQQLGSFSDVDLSLLVDDIYATGEINSLLLESVSTVVSSTVLSEIYHIPMDAVIDYEVRSANGRFGIADVAIIRVRPNRGADVVAAFEEYRADKMAEALTFNVNDSYNVTLNAQIFEDGELVCMLMLPDDMNDLGRELIDEIILSYSEE